MDIKIIAINLIISINRVSCFIDLKKNDGWYKGRKKQKEIN
jgi:hypothetical protein